MIYTDEVIVDGMTGATAKLDAGNGRRVARLYAPDYDGGRILEMTSTEPLVYATLQSDLMIVGREFIAERAALLLSNLTARCEYRVETASDLMETWPNTSSFTASSPVTTWSNTLNQG